MKNQSNTLCAALALLAVASVTAPAHADNLQVTSIASGYQATSIQLGVPFGGAIAAHPTLNNILYVSYGNYATHRILELNADTGTTRTVTPLVGNVGGLAVLTNGDLAITDNDDFSSDTILRAHDSNSDGDYLDAGEITQLIAPILTDGNFSGAQMAVAPAGNAAALPAGTLLVQTADGGTSSELLAIENPDVAPAFSPNGGAYYSGFTYNGGLAFTLAGHVLCGISEYPAGRVMALVNTNGDTDIDAGESHEIVGASVLVNSISDLAATGDGRLITSENSGTIRLFNLPTDLLTGTADPSILAETNGSYISSVRANDPTLTFTPGQAGPKATIYAGGYVTFPAATNLLAITPKSTSAATGWEGFE